MVSTTIGTRSGYTGCVSVSKHFVGEYSHNMHPALLLSMRQKDADKMLEEVTEYMATMEKSVSLQVGAEQIEEWRAELDAWEEDVEDRKKHEELKVPFEPPEEAGA